MSTGSGEERTLTDRELAWDTELARGSIVGRYVVLGRLGAGGMGIVYAAYDPELDRKVALKLLRPETGRSLSSGDGRTRLLREAQALARLTHPNVVVVHDVGTVDQRVWLAMEFVEGETLAAWLRGGERRWPDLLPTLVAAGRGLAAAHAAGLVHRDFKPDNVMVSRDGRVLVMDFGVARAGSTVESSAVTEDTRVKPTQAVLDSEVTRAGSLLGTPAYMAPEQLLSLAVDARTDQFSYCVTLWEALYGQRPFHGETIAALAFAVSQGKIRSPPSGVRTPVPGWLRRIVVRGLAVEPDARWPSMDALVEELGRGGALVRRKRVLFGLAGIACSAGLVFGAAAFRESRRTSACEALASELDDVWNDEARERVNEGLNATGMPYAAMSARGVLERFDEWAAAWKRVREQTCLSSDVRGEWSADLRGRADECLEERRMTFDALVAELAQADAAVAQNAVQAATSVPPSEPCADPIELARRPALPEDALALATSVRAALSRAAAFELAGKYAEASMAAREARGLAEPLAVPALQAQTHLALGHQLGRAGEFQDAGVQATQAYVLAGRSGAHAVAADAALYLIWLAHARARYDEGLVWAAAADVAIAQAEDPEGLRTASLLERQASLHYASGDFDQALPLYEQALAIRERALGPEHPEVAGTLTALASAHRAAGAYDQAAERQARALEIFERALGPEHPDVATSLVNLANVHYNRGSYSEARALYERARSIRERTLGPDHHAVALTLNNIALVHEAVGELAQATKLQEQALAIRERAFGPEHPEVAASLNNLGNLHQLTGDSAGARQLFARSLTIKQKLLPPDHPDIALGYNNLGNAHLSMGEYAQAKDLYLRALEAYAASVGPEHLDVARSLVNLAYAHHLLGENDEAVPHCLKAVAIYEKTVGPNSPLIADVLVGLGEIARARKRVDEAVPWLERALAIREQNETAPEELAEVRFFLARALMDSGAHHVRPVALAQQARDGFRRSQAKTPELAEVEAWLSQHADRVQSR